MLSSNSIRSVIFSMMAVFIVIFFIFSNKNRPREVVFENLEYEIVEIEKDLLLDVSFYKFRVNAKSPMTIDLDEVKRNLRVPQISNCQFSSIKINKASTDIHLRCREFIDRPSEK